VNYRLIYIGLGALAVAVVALTVAFAPNGTPTELPPPIEDVFPLPNNSVIRQTTVEVDLEVGYEATIWVDGFALPPNEIGYADATGVYRWTPALTSSVMSEWSPGNHTVRVDWLHTIGTPTTGTFEWTFRVQ
jgi:hypothetical protein